MATSRGDSKILPLGGFPMLTFAKLKGYNMCTRTCDKLLNGFRELFFSGGMRQKAGWSPAWRSPAWGRESFLAASMTLFFGGTDTKQYCSPFRRGIHFTRVHLLLWVCFHFVEIVILKFTKLKIKDIFLFCQHYTSSTHNHFSSGEWGTRSWSLAHVYITV